MNHRCPFITRSLPLAVLTLLTAFCLLPSAFAQSATATLSGTITDENGGVVPSTQITVLNAATSIKRETTTNDSGYFTVPLLPPGSYTLTATHDGFKVVEVRDIVLNVNDERSMRIQMKVGDVKEVVDVTGEAPLISESPSVGTVVDRQFVSNLPLNGRSFQSLISLTPGVVLTKTSAEAEQGQFSVNGQRPNANYFMVDGTSANIGLSNDTQLGQQAGGTSPGLTVQGGTNNLVSVDALQEFKIQTSTFAPEFGRTPGGQISIVTRSGTNRFSGTLFEYFRNDTLDANDWFNNALHLPKPAERQNDFGGVLGGPIIKNRTFFFFSYEGLRLRLPLTAITDVPSQRSRQDPRASAAVRQLLNAYPLPNGPETAGGFARFAASYSNPSTLNATSIRIDHTVSDKLTLFGRYNNSPSEAVEHGSPVQSSSVVFQSQLNTQTLTAGATWAITPSVSNDFRANYSRVSSNVSFQFGALGGAIPPPNSPFSSNVSLEKNAFSLVLLSGAQSSLIAGNGNGNRQRQANLVDNVSVIIGPHQLKFGVDYRRLSPHLDAFGFNEIPVFIDVDQLITGTTLLFVLQSNDPNVLSFTNFSAFGQDAWKITRRLTLTYGLRWDVNPAPKGEKELFTFTGLENPATLALAPNGTPLWKTTYGNFAPRVGLTYQLSKKPGQESVLRGGFGIFYDLGTGSAGNVASGFPYSRLKLLFGEPYPSAQAVPIPFSLSPPYRTVYTFDPNLKLPRTYQWNITLERSLGANQTASAAYVGAAGRRLVKVERLTNPNANITNAFITRNTATSDYHSLQLQFQRRLSKGLQALASYTFSKSLDNASSDSVATPPSERIDPQLDRGPSDFDVRHLFTAAVTYNIPVPDTGAIGNAILRNWATDAIYRARSATPVNVVTGVSLFGVTEAGRPDLIPGIPLYVDDQAVAGGRRINRAAFAIPPAGRQGTLSRNGLRGFPLSQLDFTLRRQFNLTERVNLQFRAEFFNLFNHPNFADPNNNLSVASTFGQSTQMLGRSLGSGGAFGGLNPLYQVGGPRSVQFAVKVNF